MSYSGGPLLACDQQSEGISSEDNIGQNKRDGNAELHRLYRSPNMVRVIKSRRLRWAGYVTKKEEGECAFKILIGKTTSGKRTLGRPRRRWEDNIRIDLKEIGSNTRN